MPVNLIVERTPQGRDWAPRGSFIEDLFESALGDGAVYADKHLVVTRTEIPVGLRFAGEIDMTNSQAVAQTMLTTMADTSDLHLDLTAVSFCDISGIRALIDAAQMLEEGRRFLLHGLPEQLQTVLRVTGWSEIPRVGLCACGMET